jgi:AraC family transcriptional regulator of adaptative response / DNA-3-methyladenine glycosylase II
MFDLNGDWSAVEKALGADPTLARYLKARPGLRVPGCWNGFELAVRAILERSLGREEASQAMAFLVRTRGRAFHGRNGLTHVFPEAGAVADLDCLRGGIPQDCAARISVLAAAVRDGRLRFEGVADAETFLEDLRTICDVDDWTAQYVAMRALGEPDAFPVDPGSEFVERSRRWRPWRAYAAMYLWTAEAPARVPSRQSEHDVAGRAGWP